MLNHGQACAQTSFRDSGKQTCSVMFCSVNVFSFPSPVIEPLSPSFALPWLMVGWNPPNNNSRTAFFKPWLSHHDRIRASLDEYGWKDVKRESITLNILNRKYTNPFCSPLPRADPLHTVSYCFCHIMLFFWFEAAASIYLRGGWRHLKWTFAGNSCIWMHKTVSTQDFPYAILSPCIAWWNPYILMLAPSFVVHFWFVTPWTWVIHGDLRYSYYGVPLILEGGVYNLCWCGPVRRTWNIAPGRMFCMGQIGEILSLLFLSLSQYTYI